MRRRLLNFLTALSLALCVATVVFWARRRWAFDQVVISRWALGATAATTRTLTLESNTSGVMATLSVQRETYAAGEAMRVVGPPGSGWDHEFVTAGPSAHYPRGLRLPGRLGFRFASDSRFANLSPTRTSSGFGWQVHVPHWLLIVAFAPLPAWRGAAALHHRRRRRRLTAGLCPHCGYDLRATPDKCPECGTASAESIC